MSTDAAASAEANTVDIALNLKEVQDRVKAAAEAASKSENDIRLVAVSKTKPVELLQQAYDAGCRHFGENYVQEMVDKVPVMPKDINWHFIGALQSNKCNMLVKAMDGAVDMLTVETVSSTKLANKLNNAVQNALEGSNSEKRLKVFVQVNTSGEESKSGLEPGEPVVDLCRHILRECPHLELMGLMTIGAVGDLSCFTTLVECKTQVMDAIPNCGYNGKMELSMGMSGDFEEAIAAGATNVRVGSTIFGARDYSNK